MKSPHFFPRIFLRLRNTSFFTFRDTNRTIMARTPFWFRFPSLWAISMSSNFTCLYSSLSRIMAKTLPSLVSAVSHFSVSSMLKKRRFVSLVYCSTASLCWSAKRCLILDFSFLLASYLSSSVALFFHAPIFMHAFSFFSSVSSFTTECKLSSLLFILHNTDMRSALEGERVLSHCSLTMPLSDESCSLPLPYCPLQRQAQTPVQWQKFPIEWTDTPPCSHLASALIFFLRIRYAGCFIGDFHMKLSWMDTDWLHWARLTLRRLSPLSQSYCMAGWQCRHVWRVARCFPQIYVWSQRWDERERLVLHSDRYFCQLKPINSKISKKTSRAIWKRVHPSLWVVVKSSLLVLL